MKRPPAPRRAEVVPLFAALEGVLAGLGSRTDPAFDRVRLNWARIVGPQLARVTTPAAVRDGVLRVTVDGEGWRRALEAERGRLMGRLRAVAPSLVRLHMEVRNVPPPPPAPPPAPAAPTDPRNDCVADPALRRALDELSAAVRRGPVP
jgi:hypothetical protein